MSKLVSEPIKVHQKDQRDDSITAFIWRKRLYRVVEVFASWREPAEWWNGSAMRLFLRVSAKNKSAGTFELCRTGEDWSLYRVLD